MDSEFRTEFRQSPPRVLGSLTYDFAAIEDDRAKSRLRKDERGEEAARTGSDHKGPAIQLLWRAQRRAICHVWRLANPRVAGKAFQDCGFVAHSDIERVDEDDGRSFAGIEGAFEDGAGQQILLRETQTLERSRPQRGRPMLQR